ncbi:MAG: lipoprotein insertase outer membrane protein LolB [Gallionella sp.]
MMGGLVFFWLIMLSGCASLSPASKPVALPAHPEFASFALNGRISIKHLETHQSAGLHWTHQAQSDEILLLTPLGQTAARVYRDDSNATLDDGAKHYQDADAESLMQQVLGWHLPLNGLHYWVLGMADPEVPAQIERADNGQISVLHQDGWEVRFLRYADSLPARLQLSHEDFQMQLLIDGWEWNPQ